MDKIAHVLPKLLFLSSHINLNIESVPVGLLPALFDVLYAVAAWLVHMLPEAVDAAAAEEEQRHQDEGDDQDDDPPLKF